LSTVETEKLRAALYPLLVEVTGIPMEQLAGHLRLSEDLSLDSLKRVELVSRISEQYDFNPDVDTLMELRTVDDILRLMEEHLRRP